MASNSLLRPVTSRAVHLKITPRPSNLRESREILRLISKYGEVEYFKNLKYDILSMPSTALVIFKDDSAVKRCLSDSPIRFLMGKTSPHDVTEERQTRQRREPEYLLNNLSPPSEGPFGLTQKRSVSTSAASRSAAEPFKVALSPRSERSPNTRIFQVQVNRARAKFRDQIRVGHYYGGFVKATNTVAQKALDKVVPLRGLSCINWRADEKPWRVVTRESRKISSENEKRKTLRELYAQGPDDATVESKKAMPG